MQLFNRFDWVCMRQNEPVVLDVNLSSLSEGYQGGP